MGSHRFDNKRFLNGANTSTPQSQHTFSPPSNATTDTTLSPTLSGDGSNNAGGFATIRSTRSRSVSPPPRSSAEF